VVPACPHARVPASPPTRRSSGRSTSSLPTFHSGADIYLDPAEFRQAFAADVDKTTAADMADTQRPADTNALTQARTTPAWKSIPSWYLVATQDQAIAPDLERFMAKRAAAHTVEVASSHAAMVSHPDAVTQLIEKAAR